MLHSLFLRRYEQTSTTINRLSRIDQNNDAAKVQLGEPISPLPLLLELGTGLLVVLGVTPKQLYHQQVPLHHG